MSTPEVQREMEALLFGKDIPTRLAGDQLVAIAARELGTTPTDAAESGWRLLQDMVLNADPLDERGRHPYIAARHLLGLVRYPTNPQQEIPHTRGQTWDEMKRYDSTMFRVVPPAFPLTMTRRKVLAALGGNYGTDRSLWRGGTTHRGMVARITEDFISTLEELSAKRTHDAMSADDAESLSLLSSTPEGDSPGPARVRRAVRWFVVVLCAFLAGASWLGFNIDAGKDSAGLGTKKPEPSNQLTSYWRAGWGPDRPTFTVDDAATYPVFNSITDNSVFGDERNFVNIRRADAENVWFDDLWAEPGDELFMRVYVSNSGLKNSESDPVQEAIQQARIELGLSEGDDEWSVFGTLSAVNAQTVWDGATIHTDPGVDVVMDATTAKVETNAGTRDLPAEAFDPEGALLGYERADGIVRPVYEEAAYVTVRLRVVESESKPDDQNRGDESAETETTKYRGGWGPERKMYSIKRPAEYTVLNSLKDNPAAGDERNFVSVKRLGETDSSYSDVIGVRAGDELVVMAYVSNGASDNLGVAAAVHGLTARLYLPAAGTDHSLAVTYRGENAAEVWDGASVITPEQSELVYVAGSAEFHTASASGGSYTAKDSAFERGEEMSLGHQKQDGLLPVGRLDDGSEIGNGYLTFRVKVEPQES